MGRPPRRWKCRWWTLCPACSPTLVTNLQPDRSIFSALARWAAAWKISARSPAFRVLQRPGRFDVLLGDEEDVDGRLGIDVAERQHVVGRMDDVGFHLTIGDLAEEA